MERIITFFSSSRPGVFLVIIFSAGLIAAVIAYIRHRIIPWAFGKRNAGGPSPAEGDEPSELP